MGVCEPSMSTNSWVLTLKSKDTPATKKGDCIKHHNVANNIRHLTSKETPFRFLHQFLFSRPKQMLLEALTNNHLATWPLMEAAVQKHLPDKSPAMDKGSP